MRFELFTEPLEEPEGYRDWREWFAWRPIFIDGFIVWLERVEWRPAGVYPRTLVNPCEYRLRDGA